MASWVVSSHAASYRTAGGAGSTRKLIQLPAGVRFYFFEKEGVPLPVSKGWQIYNLVMNSKPSASVYQDIASIPGYQMFDSPALPDYALTGDDGWIDQHGQSASGIFRMQDEFHKSPDTMYIRSGQWYSLSQFFNDGSVTWKPGDQVYWLACRSWA